MDQFDAPRKMPVENCDKCVDDLSLKDIESQTCQLFEEFLNLGDSILDAPCSANRLYGYPSSKQEIADSPVFVKTAMQPSKYRGIEKCEYDDDDVVTDSAPASDQEEYIAQGNAPSVKTDSKMQALAIELRKAGDKLVTQHGQKVEDVEGKLLTLVKQEAANLTYDRFSMAVDDLVGKDKDWTTFVFAFCIGKRICKHTQEGYLYAKNHFETYISTSFSQTLQNSGGVESFLRTRGSSMTQ